MAGKEVIFKGKIYDADVQIGGGPIIGGGEGIWGPPGPWVTPPIYIPIPPPPDSGLPDHIWIPVFPTNPIVIPAPPGSGKPPYVWPPTIWGGPIIPPAPGSPPGIWGPPGPWVSAPIYIPSGPPPHVWLPVFPTNPIVLPPDEDEKPEPPPDMVNPPSGAPGFWGYSYYYDSMVFVPYEGAIGAPSVPQPEGRGRK